MSNGPIELEKKPSIESSPPVATSGSTAPPLSFNNEKINQSAPNFNLKSINEEEKNRLALEQQAKQLGHSQQPMQVAPVVNQPQLMQAPKVANSDNIDNGLLKSIDKNYQYLANFCKTKAGAFVNPKASILDKIIGIISTPIFSWSRTKQRTIKLPHSSSLIEQLKKHNMNFMICVDENNNNKKVIELQISIDEALDFIDKNKPDTFKNYKESVAFNENFVKPIIGEIEKHNTTYGKRNKIASKLTFVLGLGLSMAGVIIMLIATSGGGAIPLVSVILPCIGFGMGLPKFISAISSVWNFEKNRNILQLGEKFANDIKPLSQYVNQIDQRAATQLLENQPTASMPSVPSTSSNQSIKENSKKDDVKENYNPIASLVDPAKSISSKSTTPSTDDKTSNAKPDDPYANIKDTSSIKKQNPLNSKDLSKQEKEVIT